MEETWFGLYEALDEVFLEEERNNGQWLIVNIERWNCEEEGEGFWRGRAKHRTFNIERRNWENGGEVRDEVSWEIEKAPDEAPDEVVGRRKGKFGTEFGRKFQVS